MSRIFSDTGAAQEVIDEIKEGKITNPATIYSWLNQIINDLPGTYVAEEAAELKRKISS